MDCIVHGVAESDRTERPSLHLTPSELITHSQQQAFLLGLLTWNHALFHLFPKMKMVLAFFYNEKWSKSRYRAWLSTFQIKHL